MADNVKELEATNPSCLTISAQDTAVDEVEEAVRRLTICPVGGSTLDTYRFVGTTEPNHQVSLQRKVLESLGRLRIEKARIKPLENNTPKSGGKADVEAAILDPEQSSNSPGSEDAEYVAVKKLRFDADTDDDRVLAPFAHEVNLLNDIFHQNVIKIVGFIEDLKKGIAWMVFSWEKNGNLREFVRSTNWELPERVSLISDVSEGLGYLHGRTPPICHGDLKSLNVLVNSKNRAVITDFGSARRMDSATAAADRDTDAAAVIKAYLQTPTIAPTTESLKAELAASGDFITMTGLAWTIRWAAPELLEGQLPSLASDIWALGWICWEAITGNFPFDEENDLAIVLRITRGDLPPVGDNAQLKQIKALCSLMGECWRLNSNERPTAIRCRQVISFMDQAVPSSGEGNNWTTTRSSGLLHALGWIQMRNDRMDEAEKCFQESFEVSKSVGDNHGTAKAVLGLGHVYRMQNKYSEAEESYIQARTYSQTGNQLGFAHSVRGLADVYKMRSEYSKAEELYIQARDTYSQIESLQGFANSVRGLGDVYQMRTEYSKAEELYIRARDTYSQIGNQQGFANSVRSLGDVYHMQNKYSKAEESYIEARDTYSQIGDRLGFANSVQGLGHAYSASGQYAQAEESYLETQAAFRRIGDMRSLANSLWYLSWLRRCQAQYGEAERLVCEASALYGHLDLKVDVARCDHFLTEVRQLIAA